MPKAEQARPIKSASISWEGDSKDVLSTWSTDIRIDFGFSLREMQEGRAPRLENKPMTSIGSKAFELKDYDDKKDYRLIYIARIEDVIYILHCFEKKTQKTSRRDINITTERLKAVHKRLSEEKKHARLKELK